jgi:membrane protein YdbS with pleckstrin-like domain
MVHYWVLAGAISISAPVALLVTQAEPPAWWMAIVILAAMWLGLFTLLVIRKLSVRYELTSQRMIHKVGILHRVTDRVEVIDIDDVSVSQGIIERLLRIGTIEIHSSDRSHPAIIMPGIDHAYAVAELIDEARRTERLRRGIHIEAI